MRRRTTAPGAGRGKKETKGKGSDVVQFKPQEWQRFSDQGAGLRQADLKTLDKALHEIYKPGQRGGLKDALDKMLALQDDVFQLASLCEVRFTVCLVNESEGLDRDKRDALIRAVAKDIAGAGRVNQPDPEDMLPIDMDRQPPNADVRVVDVENNPSPADPAAPEIKLTLSVLAHDASFAAEIANKILKLQVKRETVLWPTAMARMVEELQRGDQRDERLDALGLRFVSDPVVQPLATDFLKFATQPEAGRGARGHACVPQRDEAVSTLLVGGRDPYKNDLLRWIVGVDPQGQLRSRSVRRQHAFTCVFASSYAEDFRGYHIACRMGSVEDEVAQAIRGAREELLKRAEGLGLPKGAALDRRQFEEVMGSVMLARVDGNDRLVPLGQDQVEDLWSKAQLWGIPDEQGLVRADGRVFLEEFLEAFKSVKEEKEGAADGGAAARRRLMNAGRADRDNEQRLQKIQEALRAVEQERKREADHGRLRAIQVKEDARAASLRSKFAEVAAVCEARAMAAERAVLSNKAVLDDPHADAKAIAKAQKGLAQANKTILEAKKQLEQAQKQHEAAVMAAVRVKDMHTHFPDATTTLQSVEAVEEKLRALLKAEGRRGLPDVFLDMDCNADGRLSASELRDGLEGLLRTHSVSVGKGLLDQVVARMDVSGDGVVDMEEFTFQFGVGGESDMRRMRPSLDGLPCLATYHGQAKVPYFKDGKARVWQPVPTEDFAAMGRQFDALVGKQLGPGRYRVSFVHKKVDPLAHGDEGERIIYGEFTDFPDQLYVITQECTVEELQLSHCGEGLEAVQRVVEDRLRGLQQELAERVVREVRRRVETQGAGLEARIVEALALGDREMVLFDERRGLLGLWEEWKEALPLPSKDPDERDRCILEVALAVRRIGDERARCGAAMARWDALAAGGGRALESCFAREAFLFFRHLGRPRPPLLVQAPELLAVSKPKDDGQSDILLKVQRFFGDPASREPVERQIKRKFDEFDKDATGGLNKTEFKSLLKATVNRGEERLGASEVDSLIELLDADGSGTIEVDELLNAIKPRGEKCPYDQVAAMDFVAGEVERVLVLVDVQHTRFNPWEKEVIAHLHRRFPEKLCFASFVTAEHQAAIKKADAIMKLVYSSAEDVARFLGDERVGRELRNNVVSVGALIDHVADRDGNYKVRGSKGNGEWRRLPNALGRVLVRACTSEGLDARRMLEETTQSLHALSAFLMKRLKEALPHMQRAGGAGEDGVRGALAAASGALQGAAGAVEQQVAELERKMQVLEVQGEVRQLGKAGRQAQKTGERVLARLGLDSLSKAEGEALEKAAHAKAEAVEMEVRQGRILKWRSRAHVEHWLRGVAQRSPAAGELLRKVVAEYNVSGVSDIVALDASRVRRCAEEEGAGDAAALVGVVQEVNRVRSRFWGVEQRLGAAQRNAWLLVREQFLQLEDLKLLYSLFHKQIAIPQYWHRALLDGLELLTAGLQRERPLQLIRVPGELSVTRWDGSVKTKEISHWYFTDGEKDEQQRAVRGQVSADSVTALILHIRKDILELVGWSADADRALEEGQYGWRVPEVAKG